MKPVWKIIFQTKTNYTNASGPTSPRSRTFGTSRLCPRHLRCHARTARSRSVGRNVIPRPHLNGHDELQQQSLGGGHDGSEGPRHHRHLSIPASLTGTRTRHPPTARPWGISRSGPRHEQRRARLSGRTRHQHGRELRHDRLPAGASTYGSATPLSDTGSRTTGRLPARPAQTTSPSATRRCPSWGRAPKTSAWGRTRAIGCRGHRKRRHRQQRLRPRAAKMSPPGTTRASGTTPCTSSRRERATSQRATPR
jgi:hypothetical protein